MRGPVFLLVSMTEHYEMVTTSTRYGRLAHFCGCGYRPKGSLEEQKRLTQEHIMANGGELWDGISR